MQDLEQASSMLSDDYYGNESVIQSPTSQAEPGPNTMGGDGLQYGTWDYAVTILYNTIGVDCKRHPYYRGCDPTHRGSGRAPTQGKPFTLYNGPRQYGNKASQGGKRSSANTGGERTRQPGPGVQPLAPAADGPVLAVPPRAVSP